MPEGVEVCITALYLDKRIKNGKLTEFNILGGRYKRKQSTLKGFSLLNSIPLKIKSVNSKGKFLWIELENSLYIMNTFGLEGEWGFCQKKHSDIELVVRKNNKTLRLYFTDSRKFGTFEITDKTDVLDKKINSLGIDLLKDNYTDDDIYNRMVKINKRNSKIKIIKILMDQKAGIGSGLGNYLSVEILYHAKISPHTTIGTIVTNKKLAYELIHSIRYVLRLSYATSTEGYFNDCDPDFTKYLKHLHKKLHNNTSKNNFQSQIKIGKNKFKFNVYLQKKDPHGNPIQRDKIISNRSTYWSPIIQIN